MASSVPCHRRKVRGVEYNQWAYARTTDEEERWTSARDIPSHIRDYERVRWAMVPTDPEAFVDDREVVEEMRERGQHPSRVVGECTLRQLKGMSGAELDDVEMDDTELDAEQEKEEQKRKEGAKPEGPEPAKNAGPAFKAGALAKQEKAKQKAARRAYTWAAQQAERAKAVERERQRIEAERWAQAEEDARREYAAEMLMHSGELIAISGYDRDLQTQWQASHEFQMQNLMLLATRRQVRELHRLENLVAAANKPEATEALMVFWKQCANNVPFLLPEEVLNAHIYGTSWIEHIGSTIDGKSPEELQSIVPRTQCKRCRSYFVGLMVSRSHVFYRCHKCQQSRPAIIRSDAAYKTQANSVRSTLSECEGKFGTYQDVLAKLGLPLHERQYAKPFGDGP